MTILALDLGTTTGFAVNLDEVGTVMSGTWELTPKRYEGGGMRYLHFRNNLDCLKRAYDITEIIFEEVRQHAGINAAHAYGGFKATLESWCEENSIPYTSLPVGTIKKSFTGNGKASKEAMVTEARMRGYDPVDDNAADAIALLCFRMRQEVGKEDVIG